MCFLKMGISGYEFNHEAMVWLELFRTSLRTWLSESCHFPGLVWIGYSKLPISVLMSVRVIEKKRRFEVNPRMLGSVSIHIWRIYMPLTTPYRAGVQVNLRTLGYSMIFSGCTTAQPHSRRAIRIQKGSTFGTEYSGP